MPLMNFSKTYPALRATQVIQIDMMFNKPKFERLLAVTKSLETIFKEKYKDNKKIHKLYYLKDKLGKWLKSKLIYYKDDKADKVVRSERKEWWA